MTRGVERGAATAASVRPTILLFGDSHSYAVGRAVEKRKGKGHPVPLTVHRLSKEKNGKRIGDTTMEQFLDRIRKLAPDDVVLSMIGGNQHAVLSTIQHPEPFDFFTPQAWGMPQPASCAVVPFKALEDAMTKGLRNGDAKSLRAIRQATAARVVHIIPPPPKADNAFIQGHHESLFAGAGIATLGVSHPVLRLKFWMLQTLVLRRICRKLNIELLMPPRVAVTEGFLKPDYYADDATHANWRYGERLLREIEKRFIPDHGAQVAAR